MVTANIDHMPIEGNDWQQWRARIWNQIADAFGTYPGLAPLEQWMLRSKRERRCVDCGEPGSVWEQSVIVASVRHYWLCAGCDRYYREKGGENTS